MLLLWKKLANWVSRTANGASTCKQCVVCAEKTEGEEEQKPSESQEEGAGKVSFISTDSAFRLDAPQRCHAFVLKLHHILCTALHLVFFYVTSGFMWFNYVFFHTLSKVKFLHILCGFTCHPNFLSTFHLSYAFCLCLLTMNYSGTFP